MFLLIAHVYYSSVSRYHHRALCRAIVRVIAQSCGGEEVQLYNYSREVVLLPQNDTHTHTHTHVHLQEYIYICNISTYIKQRYKSRQFASMHSLVKRCSPSARITAITITPRGSVRYRHATCRMLGCDLWRLALSRPYSLTSSVPVHPIGFYDTGATCCFLAARAIPETTDVFVASATSEIRRSRKHRQIDVPCTRNYLFNYLRFCLRMICMLLGYYFPCRYSPTIARCSEKAIENKSRARRSSLVP